MNATKLLAKYEMLAEAAHKTGAYNCARKWSIKAEKLEAVISALEQIEEPKMIEIELDDMRYAGKPGYVAQIVGGERKFLNGSCEDYGKSTRKMKFQIIEDGIYEICDANYGSRKRSVEFVKVEKGEIIADAESLADLLLANIKLPDLQGSDKQVTWANDIRAKYLGKVLAAGKPVPQWAYEKTSAKFYIDNRSQMVLAR